MIDIHKLRVFCTVVDTGSFSLAASQLSLSQPVVSAHVLELESLVGLGLIDRSKRPVGPTEEGKYLYDAAQKLFTGIKEVETTVADINQSKRGDVTVSAGSLVGSVILPPLLFRFREIAPSINIHVRRGTSQQTLDRVSSGRSDFGLLFSVAPRKPFSVDLAGQVELVMVQPTGRGTPTSKRSLAKIIEDEGFVAPVKKMRFLTTIEKMLHKHGVSRLSVRYEVGSWEAAKLTVVHGMGVTILPRQSVAKEIAARQLKELKLGKEALRAKIYMVQRRTKPIPSAVTTFRKFLLQELSVESL
jgi:DNA-binding transcriptional LysR family regulator